jgi:hypothetical protein
MMSRRGTLSLLAVLYLGAGVVEEAAAASPAGQVHRADRRRQRRHHRHKQRRRRRHHTGDPQGLLRNIAFHVYNGIPSGLKLNYWDYDDVHNPHWYARFTTNLPANPSTSSSEQYFNDYHADWPQSLVSVELGDPAMPIVVVVQNVFGFDYPLVTIGEGGHVSSDGWTNGTTLSSVRIKEGNEVKAVSHSAFVLVHRHDDTDRYKSYSINITYYR